MNAPVTAVRIEKLRRESAESYDQFLLSHPETLFYSCSKYKDFLKHLLGCDEEYLLAWDGQSVCGALPLLYLERDGKRVYNSLPFYGSNGGVVADNPHVHRELVEAYKELALRETTLSATVVGSPFAPEAGNGVPHNLTDQRIGQFTNIDFPANHRDEILAVADSSARRNVAKATREGVTVEIDHSQMARLHEMHRANIAAIGGLAKSEKFFALIPEHFAPGRDFDLYVARKDGLVIAGLLLFYFNRTVEYITPAIDSEYRSLQPLSLILIEAMIEACKRGYRRWNWGGTWHTQQGVYRFKKKWGADERGYSYFIQLNDESLLQWPQEKIRETFPDFYVAPFSALKKQNETDG